MRTLILLPIVAGLASACVITTSSPSASAQQGADAARDYNLKGFERVDTSAGVNVILRQGPYSVHAESRDGDLSRLILRVDGDTLVVGREQNWFSGWGGRGPRYTVTVSAPTYRGFEASSGSNIDGSNLSLKNLKVDVSSGADVGISGVCADLDVSVSSGANFDGEDLRCETASADASSGGNVDAWASRSAEGDASSGADITFHGKPVNFSKDTSSGGSVRAM